MDSNVHGGFTVPLNTLQLLYFTIFSEKRFLIIVFIIRGVNSRYRRKSSSTKHGQMLKISSTFHTSKSATMMF